MGKPRPRAGSPGSHTPSHSPQPMLQAATSSNHVAQRKAIPERSGAGNRGWSHVEDLYQPLQLLLLGGSRTCCDSVGWLYVEWGKLVDHGRWTAAIITHQLPGVGLLCRFQGSPCLRTLALPWADTPRTGTSPLLLLSWPALIE